jgi:hypothetical protein
MNWLEPWRETLRSQPRFNMLSAEVARHGLIWSVVLIIATAAARGKFNLDLLDRIWLVVPLSFVLAAVQYAVQWLCPSTVHSVPKGIIRAKGADMTLIPWAAIRRHEIQTTPRGKVLVLTLAATTQPTVLLLPSTIDTVPIEQELREHAGMPG